MPIYMAGCRRLAVFAGPTFTSRLWCAVELFVYIEMGAEIGSIDVMAFDIDPGNPYSRNIFANFDVTKTSCTYQRDRQYFLQAIQYEFGSHVTFNAAIQRILTDLCTID